MQPPAQRIARTPARVDQLNPQLEQLDPELAQRVAKLERLVESGRSFTQAVNEVVPPPKWHKPLMRRASFLSEFDTTIFNAVIRRDFEVSFEEFISTFGVEHTQQSLEEGTQLSIESYRIAPVVAADLLAEWLNEHGGREELIDFAKTAYDHTRQRPTTRPFERLRLQVAADPPGALAEFDRLFDEADRQFDLAFCHALIRVLRELDNFTGGGRSVPLRLLSSELRSRCDELTPYIAARGYFIDDYAKSANYLERAGLFAQVDDFLKLEQNGLLSLYGGGGQGKSMFLRWLVARHCLPRPNSIPVAKVDFDDINVAKLREFPWLILVRLAEQLDRQLPATLLSEFLAPHLKYLPILLPTIRLPREIPVDDLEQELKTSPPQGVADEFALKLAGRRVLLVLDTLEEAVLHYPESLREVLKLFRHAWGETRQSGRMKLILAGRYKLKDGEPKHQFLEPDDPAPLEVARFDKADASRYLSDIRHIHPPLVPLIVRKSDGNPFILALLADEVEEQNIRDEKKIEELKPEFAFLIQRVINRIPYSEWAVRWVVRYGVVAQRLTPEFLENVMKEHLLREAADNAAGRMDELNEYANSFPRRGIVEGELATLWDALRKYAAPASWLRVDADQLRFQPEVVRPMRALLEKEQVYQALHLGAARWFEHQAQTAYQKDDPIRGASLLAEVFFHRLQLKDAGLEDWWHNHMLTASDPAERRIILEATARLAAEAPNTLDGHRLLSFEFLGRAHLELAKLNAGIPALGLPYTKWGLCRLAEPRTVRGLLEDAGKYLGPVMVQVSLKALVRNICEGLGFVQGLYRDKEGGAILRPYAQTFTLVEMALALSQREYARALECSAYLQRNDDSKLQLLSGETYAFHLLKARALIGQQNPAAEFEYQAAAGLVDPGVARWEIYAESGRELARIGNLGRGLGVFERALAEHEAAAPPGFRLDAAELFLNAGDYSRAEALASLASEQLSPAQRFRSQRVATHCAIARGRLLDAQQRLDQLQPSDSDPLQTLQMKELRGRFAIAVYDINTAVQLLQEAFQGYASAGERDAAGRTLLQAIQLAKELKGDRAGALRLSSSASGFTSEFLALEIAHLRFSSGFEQSSGHPGGWEDAALQLLTTTERNRDLALLTTIAQHLETVAPPSRRYEYLHFFRWLPQLEGVASLEAEFRRLVPAPSPRDPDFFAHVFDVIELLRCLGAESARRLLEQAFSVVERLSLEHDTGVELDLSAPNVQVFVYERLIDTAQRLFAPIFFGMGGTVLQLLGVKSLPPIKIKAVLENCSRISGYPLEAATKIRLQNVLLQRQMDEDITALNVALPDSLRQTQFEVMYYVNQSRLLSKVNASEAKKAVRNAASVLQTLGREAEAQRLLAETEAGELDKPKVDEKRARIPLTESLNPLQTLATSSSELVSLNQARLLLEEPQRLIHFMREVLPEEIRTKPLLEFVINDSASGSSPWEWIASERQTCFRSAPTLPTLPSNPIAQLFWSKLPLRLRRALGSLRPVKIALLRPPVAYQEQIGRGQEVHSRRPLTEIYRAHGAKVFEPASLNFKEISLVLQDSEPQLIQIQAPVVERHGMLSIDLPLEEQHLKGERALLGVDFWTQQFTHEPVVILDPPRPPSEIEVARQLLLRNRFASELAAKGKVRAVLCVGLLQPSQAELAAERLAFTFEAIPALGDVLRLFQKELPGDRFATQGAALFAANPETLIK